MLQRKETISSAFSHLGLARPSTSESSGTSISSSSSSSPRALAYYSSSSSAAPAGLNPSAMNQLSSSLRPLSAHSSLEHKSSSTSIRSLLNDPVVKDPRKVSVSPTNRDRRTPTGEQRQLSPLETPRADNIPRFPSPGNSGFAAQPSRSLGQVGQDRKLSEGGSEGESSSRGSAKEMERPPSSVSDASSKFEYPFQAPSSTASITYQQQQYLSSSTSVEPDMYSTMPSKAIQTNGSSRAPISRATKACNACRSRKVRCDAGGPRSSATGEEMSCTRCKDSGIQCVYTGSQRKRGPAPGANRPGQRRKPSSLELEMGTAMALVASHDMSRTRSTSSIGSPNGHYHPYAPVGLLPSPPSAYRGMSHSAKIYPPFHPGEYPEYSRRPPTPYDRPLSGIARGPMTAPLPGYRPREYDYRHPMSSDGQYPPPPLSGTPYGYSPHDQVPRHPPPPSAMHHEYPRSRPSYPDIDPALQSESSRPSTGLSGWQGGEKIPAGPRPPMEQEPPPRVHEAAAYQAGYEAALREARIAAKVEAQREEQDRRDRERERMMQMERDARNGAGPPRTYEDPRRNSYWERPESRDPARDKMEERAAERERERHRVAEMAKSNREHHYGEIDTRVTLPPITQMDR